MCVATSHCFSEEGLLRASNACCFLGPSLGLPPTSFTRWLLALSPASRNYKSCSSRGLKKGGLKKSLIVTPPQDFAALGAHAQKFITLEESLLNQNERVREKQKNHPVSDRKAERHPPPQFEQFSEKDHPGSDRKVERHPPPQFEKFTPLISSRSTVLCEIERQGLATPPKACKKGDLGRDFDKYCHYHKTWGQ
ncbi:hypothetical protein CRG98_043364 [Punica granatum]|uniref:Uncharacterized protein n=1 Tax=Punica granatum TaxID=22663 RepID=A0A2I0HX24_PUNGR|nr:hypothetical protein CRG98_043364 [Punica granatum]